MVIFELPENFPAVLNAVGRTHRIGQASPQDVTILTLARSYDDFMLARAFGKYAVEMYGKAGLADLARNLDLRGHDLQLRQRKGVALRQTLAGELVRRRFGTRTCA